MNITSFSDKKSSLVGVRRSKKPNSFLKFNGQRINRNLPKYGNTYKRQRWVEGLGLVDY
jgi:hypothetical protein